MLLCLLSPEFRNILLIQLWNSQAKDKPLQQSLFPGYLNSQPYDVKHCFAILNRGLALTLKCLHFAHRVHLYDSHNEQRLFPFKALSATVYFL